MPVPADDVHVGPTVAPTNTKAHSAHREKVGLGEVGDLLVVAVGERHAATVALTLYPQKAEKVVCRRSFLRLFVFLAPGLYDSSVPSRVPVPSHPSPQEDTHAQRPVSPTARLVTRSDLMTITTTASTLTWRPMAPTAT